jgi:AAA15 family ATPase/GTPase
MRVLFNYMPKDKAKKDKKKKFPFYKRNFLTNLHIKNFKSFFGPVGSQEINVKLAPKITLLFGKNSAGKSSLLQAIKLIQQSYDNGDDMVINPASTYSGGLSFPSYKNLVSKKEIMRSISLGVTTEECTYQNNKRLDDPNSKTIIKKFSNKGNKILCNEIDFYSPTDDKQKFISLKNTPFQLDGLQEYYKSEISFIENKYAWKELFKYSFKYKKKIIPYLERCIDFAADYKRLINTKRSEKEAAEKEIDKIVHQASRPGVFSPVYFRFENTKIIQKHIAYLKSMKDNYDSFIKYIGNDIKKNTNFLYKNNKTFNKRQIFEIVNRTLLEDEKNKIFTSLESNATFTDILCYVVSSLCGSKYPSQTSFDPNSNDKSEREKTLLPRKMIDYCNDMVLKSIECIRVFQGQRALPNQYVDTRSPEKGFVGYNYEFLHEVISEHRKDIDKWLNHCGYDFKIDTESGGPTSVTLVQHRKKGFKVDYKQGGLGAENILPIIAQSVAAKNKILIFEEPERRAHPKLQSKMADLFVECSKNNQFVIETHSENLLLGILKNIRDGKIKHTEVQVSYVYIDKDQSKVDELKINENGNFESSWRDGFFTERLDLL